MAVPEQTPYIEHTGNGVTTSFSLGFQCESKDHLIVLVDEIEPPIATWSLIGGNVVFTTAPTSGQKITIQRNTPFGRTTDYQSYNNSFRPPAVNNDFDRVWWKIQELGVRDWLLDLKIQKFRDDVNLTAMEETLEQAQSLRDDTAAFAVDVQNNVTQSQTLLANTTEQANAAALSATNANNSKDLAKQYADNIDASLTAIAGGHKAYGSLAAALANTSTLPMNSIVEITNDPDPSKNGTYQWNGGDLTKSDYDPLTQAKADATTKANAAEVNAKAYNDEVVFSGLTENIYETDIEATPSASTALAGTVIYAEPALYDGVISKAHGYLQAAVTQFKAKIFERVGNDFLLVTSSNIPIVLGSSEHVLDTPLSIKRGQYVGFFAANAGTKHVVKSGSRPFKYASGDTSKTAVGTLSTNATYLMYFESKRLSLDGVVQNNVANTIKNSTMLEALSNQLVVANDFIGAEILTGGTAKASVEYVAYTKTVENAGFVDSVDFNLLADDSVAFFSLRMQSDNSYHIINETPYIAYTSGINTAVLEDFYVKDGDILGWKTLAKNLALDSSAQNVTPYYSPTRTSANVMTVSTSHALAQPRIKFNISYAPKALQVVVLTQAQYDALPSKDPNVLYGVV